MNTIDLQSDIIKVIQQIDDVNILNAIKIILQNFDKTKLQSKDDFWDDLPEDIKLDIEEAIIESNKGYTKPHELVMKQIADKYRFAL